MVRILKTTIEHLLIELNYLDTFPYPPNEPSVFKALMNVLFFNILLCTNDIFKYTFIAHIILKNNTDPTIMRFYYFRIFTSELKN